MVSNSILTDCEISLKAKGLYAYIISKPDNWDFSADRIKLENKEGRSAILAALKELEQHKYLKRYKKPDGRVIYQLFNNPMEFNEFFNPKSENRTLGQEAKVRKPHGAEIDTISKTVTSNKKELLQQKIKNLIKMGSEVPSYQIVISRADVNKDDLDYYKIQAANDLISNNVKADLITLTTRYVNKLKNYIENHRSKNKPDKPYVAHGNDHKYIKPAVEEITMAQRQNETDDEYEARVNAREADGDVRVKRSYKKSNSNIRRPQLNKIT